MVSNWVYCLVEKTRNHRSGTSQDEELNAPRPQIAPVTPIGPTCTGVIELSQRLQRRVRAAVSHVQPIQSHLSSFNHSSLVSADPSITCKSPSCGFPASVKSPAVQNFRCSCSQPVSRRVLRSGRSNYLVLLSLFPQISIKTCSAATNPFHRVLLWHLARIENLVRSWGITP